MSNLKIIMVKLCVCFEWKISISHTFRVERSQHSLRVNHFYWSEIASHVEPELSERREHYRNWRIGRSEMCIIYWKEATVCNDDTLGRKRYSAESIYVSSAIVVYCIRIEALFLRWALSLFFLLLSFPCEKVIHIEKCMPSDPSIRIIWLGCSIFYGHWKRNFSEMNGKLMKKKTNKQKINKQTEQSKQHGAQIVAF